MKKIFFLLCCSLLMMNKTFAQMIVANPPQPITPFVMFSVVSPQATPKGVLLTPMSVAQRDQITKNSAPDGLLVYNTTEQSFNVLKSGNWTVIADTNRVKTMLDLKATSLLSLINLAEQNAKAYTDSKVIYLNGRIDSLKIKQTNLTNALSATNTNFNNLVTTTIPTLQSQITNHTHSSITNGNITANVGSNGLKVSNLAPNQMVVTGNDGALKSELLGNLVNGTSWGLSGNNVATGAFIGTTNNEALNFKVGGQNAGRIESQGFVSTSYGFGSLQYENSGYWNSAFGENVLFSNTSGKYNSGFGSSVLGSNNGDGNSGFGYEALKGNQSTSYNSAFGTQSGNYSSGNNNTFLGAWTGVNVQGATYNNSTAIGAGAKITKSDEIVIGTSQTAFATIYGQQTSTCDIRAKMNIGANIFGLALIKDMETSEYEYKDVPGKRRTGFIAQALARLEQKYGKLPFLITPENVEKEFYQVSTVDMIPITIKAIQEQQTIIETQEKKIADLKKENEAMKRRMEAIEKFMMEMKK